MKILISATGKDIESNIDATFGRAPFFLIVGPKSEEVKVIENKARDRSSGVGITSVNVVLNEEMDAVITKDIGPEAYKVFESCGIKIYQAEGKIKDAIQDFKEGKLSEMTKATVQKYNGLKRRKRK